MERMGRRTLCSEQLQSAIGGLQGQTTQQPRLTPDTDDPTVTVFW